MTVVAWIPGHSASYLGSSSSIPGVLAFLGRACLSFLSSAVPVCQGLPLVMLTLQHSRHAVRGSACPLAAAVLCWTWFLKVSQAVHCPLVRAFDQTAEAVQSVAWVPAVTISLDCWHVRHLLPALPTLGS